VARLIFFFFCSVLGLPDFFFGWVEFRRFGVRKATLQPVTRVQVWKSVYFFGFFFAYVSFLWPG